MASYKTVEGTASASLVVKRSRFVAHVEAVSDMADAERVVREAMARERGAGHHAMACVLGEGGMERRSDDGGEPAGTAGAPVLGAIVNRGLTNVVVVVSRVFGGVKLGAGGLTRAYGAAASAALQSAETVTMEPAVVITAEVGHEMAPRIQHYLLGRGYEVGMSATARVAVLHIVVPEKDSEYVEGYLRASTKGSAVLSTEACRHLKNV
jgi:putative IMPACT (imprinted ancient) family translation regulator